MHHRLVDVAHFGGPVELIGAGTEDDRQEAAGSMADFRRCAGGVDLDFLEGILRGGDLLVGAADVTDAGLLAVDAVHGIAHGAGALPENVVTIDVLRAGVIVGHPDGALLAHRDFEQLIAREHLSGGSCLGFQKRSRAFHLHAFCDRAHFHGHVDAWNLAGANLQAVLHIALKADRLDGQPVKTRREVRNIVRAFGGSDRFRHKRRIEADYANCRHGDGRAASVGNISHQGAGAGCLRPGRATQQRQSRD